MRTSLLNQKIHLGKTNIFIFSKLYKDIIEPVDLFKNNLSSIFEECQIEMKQVI